MMVCANCDKSIPADSGFIAKDFNMDMVCRSCVHNYVKFGKWDIAESPTVAEVIQGRTFECPKCGKPTEVGIERVPEHVDKFTIKHEYCGWGNVWRNGEFNINI